MTVTIDWNTSIITVPKVDTTLIQSVPTEIREHDMNVFRLVLRALEASVIGMPYLKTHNHFAPIGVGGITLARVVELVNSFTVTYEDGPYAVNIIGGNSNIGDNVNVNQVSIRSFNSAGLVTSAGIEAIEYGSAVCVDVNSTAIGTLYPVGTPRFPTNNIPDAVLIAENRGFSRINIIGNFTLDTGDIIAGYTIYGQDSTKTLVTVNTGAETSGAIFENCTVTGIFDNAANFHLCALIDIEFVQGYIYECVLGGKITLAGVGLTGLYNCWDGKVGDEIASFPVIDFNGSGRSLIIRNYSGDIAFENKTGTEYVEVDQVSGIVYIANTVTNGTIKLRGIIDVDDNSTGSANIDVSQVVFPEQLQLSVYGNAIHIDSVNGTSGTQFPQGTEQFPVDTITDAVIIAIERRIGNFHIASVVIIPAGVDISGYAFYGANPIESVVVLTSTCITERTQFYNLIVTGVINGAVYMEKVGLQTLIDIGSNDFPSVFNECIFRAGSQAFKSGLVTPQNIHFVNCVGGELGIPANLDFNNTVSPIIFKGYIGGIKILNCTAIEAECSFSIANGRIEFDSTCTNGTVSIRGNIDPIIDNSGIGFTVNDRAFDIDKISYGVWDEIINSTHITPNSAGFILKMLKDYAVNKMTWDEDSSRFVIYDDDDSTPIHYINVTNKNDGSIVMDSEAVVNRDGQVDA